jgi:hypothetical protein
VGQFDRAPDHVALPLAGVIIFAGVYTLSRGMDCADRVRTTRARSALLVAGRDCRVRLGLYGVGGPALSVPLMVLFGFPALVSIGASVLNRRGRIGNARQPAIRVHRFRGRGHRDARRLAGVIMGGLAHAVARFRARVAILCLWSDCLVIRELGAALTSTLRLARGRAKGQVDSPRNCDAP